MQGCQASSENPLFLNRSVIRNPIRRVYAPGGSILCRMLYLKQAGDSGDKELDIAYAFRMVSLALIKRFSRFPTPKSLVTKVPAGSSPDRLYEMGCKMVPHTAKSGTYRPYSFVGTGVLCSTGSW